MIASGAIAEPVATESAGHERTATCRVRAALHADVRSFFDAAVRDHPETDWTEIRRLAASGYIREAELAARNSVPFTTHVLHCLGDAYTNVGWVKPAAIAYELAGDRNRIAAAAERLLEKGHFEEAQRLLKRARTPLSDRLLGIYLDACRRHAWHVHAKAEKLRRGRGIA